MEKRSVGRGHDSTVSSRARKEEGPATGSIGRPTSDSFLPVQDLCIRNMLMRSYVLYISPGEDFLNRLRPQQLYGIRDVKPRNGPPRQQLYLNLGACI